MTKPAKPNLTAEPVYENLHIVTLGLLERLQELLTDMPAPGNDEHPIHWGHVGDIGYVNGLLVEAVRFLEQNGK